MNYPNSCQTEPDKEFSPTNSTILMIQEKKKKKVKNKRKHSNGSIIRARKK